jgi:hypothetical protein
MTEDQIVTLVLKQLSGRSFITINEAISLVGAALAEQKRLDTAMGADAYKGDAQPRTVRRFSPPHDPAGFSG